MRRFTRSIVTLLGFWLLMPFPAAAEQDILARWESFPAMAAEVLQRDHGLKAAAADMQSAEAGQREAEAGLSARLNLTGEHKVENVANAPMLALRPDLASDDIVQESSAAITFARLLAPNQELQTALDQSAVAVDMSRIARQQQQVEVLLELQEAYHAVLTGYDALQVARQYRRYTLSELDIVMRQQEAGTASLLDVQRKQHALADVESQLLQAESGFRIAAFRLLQKLGHQADAGAVEAWAARLLARAGGPPRYWSIDYERSVVYALEHRPELLLIDSQEQLARIEWSAADERRDLTGQVSYRRLQDDWVFQGSVDSDKLLTAVLAQSWREEFAWEQDWQDWADWDDYPDLEDFLADNWPEFPETENPWELTFSISYQFGTRSQREAELDRLTSAKEKVQHEYEGAAEMIALDVYSQWEMLKQAWMACDVAEKAKQEAELTLANLESLQQKGTKTDQQVEEGKLLVEQARHRYFRAGLDYSAAKAGFAAALGLRPDTLLTGISSGDWEAAVALSQIAW